MKDNNSQVTITPLEKDHFNVHVNMIWMGRFERSELRHIIEQLDNAIQMTDKDLNKCTTMELEHILLHFTWFNNKHLQRAKRILDQRYRKRKVKKV